jgi:hypothetical protein
MKQAALALFFSAAAGPLLAQQTLPPSEQYHLQGEYWRWTPKLTSTIQKGAGGTLLDPIADLGFADEKTHEVRAALQFKPGHKLRGSYTPIDYRGDLSAPRSFRFGGSTYTQNERVVTTLKGGYYSASYEFDLLKGPKGYVGGLLGAKYFDVDSVLVAPESGRLERDAEKVPIPVVGLAFRRYVGRISVSGEASGLTIGKRGHMYEVMGAAALHVSDRLAIQAGYRFLKLHGQEAPDLIELRLRGWQFGAQLSL